MLRQFNNKNNIWFQSLLLFFVNCSTFEVLSFSYCFSFIFFHWLTHSRFIHSLVGSSSSPSSLPPQICLSWQVWLYFVIVYYYYYLAAFISLHFQRNTILGMLRKRDENERKMSVILKWSCLSAPNTHTHKMQFDLCLVSPSSYTLMYYVWPSCQQIGYLKQEKKKKKKKALFISRSQYKSCRITNTISRKTAVASNSIESRQMINQSETNVLKGTEWIDGWWRKQVSGRERECLMWVNEWMNEWVDEWVSEWVSERQDKVAIFASELSFKNGRQARQHRHYQVSLRKKKKYLLQIGNITYDYKYREWMNELKVRIKGELEMNVHVTCSCRDHLKVEYLQAVKWNPNCI